MDPKDGPVFDGWECLEKLGEGGMCSVWRVRPTSGAGPERAIKVLMDPSDASVKRFTDEARLLQRIDHPNVLRIHELHDEQLPPWIVMDLLAGRDLEETREQQGAMDPERAAQIFADVASGLARVHALGVRHRDIKPANIMLGHDGIPRLIDFGIARETAKAHVTQQGFVVGTASYLPPEIFVEDDAHAIQDTAAADVYALGQSLCELLTGAPLHARGGPGTNATMLVSIMKDKLDRPHLDPRSWRAVPDDLAEIVIAATKQEPTERIGSARDLEERLRGWLRQRQAGAHAPLTAVDPMALPPPPTTTFKPRRTPEPAPGGAEAPRTSEQRATPAPTQRRSSGATAAVGAAGFGLVGLTAAATLLITAVGVGGLIVLAPPPSASGSAAGGGIRSAVDEARPALARCATPETRGDVVLSVAVANGRGRATLEGAELGDDVEGCLREKIEAVRFPAGESARVRLPILFQ